MKYADSNPYRMKRIFDITFSLMAVILFAIPAVVIALIIKFYERHPIFFYQERIGRDFKPFRIIKFQTMVDQKPTRTGKILRMAGIDEWPQFINVLMGEMSIVGPRALTLADIVRLGWDAPRYRVRWQVAPGITGFAQLYGGQHRSTSWFWDIQYLSNCTLLTDLGVVVVSFLMNVFGKRRVRRILFQQADLK